MKQHPIDDLFARKLREHSVNPERTSWEELQRRRIQQKSQSPFVWWYAAAGIAVVGLVAWWVWSTQSVLGPSTTGPDLARQAPKPAIIPEKPYQSQSDEAVREPPVLAYQKPAVGRSGSKRTTGPGKNVSEQLRPMDANPAPAAESETPQTSATGEIAALSMKQPERTLVVRVAEPELAATVTPEEMVQTDPLTSEEEQPKKKRFRVGRLIRQFTKLKSGEPIEWQEVGIQPGALLAKATEKVEEGKEKVTTSYENLRYNSFKKKSDR